MSSARGPSPLPRRVSSFFGANKQATDLSAANLPAGVHLIVSQTYDELAERAAIMLGSRVMENPALNVSVTVGATPTGLYQQLAKLATRGVVPLDEAHFLLWDEFYGPGPAGARPHLQELQRNLFTGAHVPPEHVHGPEGALSATQAAAAFQEVSNLRRLDVAVLGLGPTGELGWLRGGAAAAGEGVHVCDLRAGSASEAQHGGYSECVSMGHEQLANAREVFLLAVNRNKAEVVARVLADHAGATAAGHLLHTHPRVFLFLDTAAAAHVLAQVAVPAVHVTGFTIISRPDALTNKRVLCVSPHPDDTSISAGATLALLVANNNVTSVVATTGHRAYIPHTTTAEERTAVREREAAEEATILGVRVHYWRLPLYNVSGQPVGEDDVKIVAQYLQETRPDIIFMPQTGDTHQTHRAVAKAVLVGLRHVRVADPEFRPDVYMYEGPWSLFSKGCYNVIVSPAAEHFATKLAAIAAHKSQTARTAYDRAADSLAQLRGALVPEQDLAGWGGQPPELAERVELFYKRTIASDDDVAELLTWLDANQAPKK